MTLSIKRGKDMDDGYSVAVSARAEETHSSLGFEKHKVMIFLGNWAYPTRARGKRQKENLLIKEHLKCHASPTPANPLNVFDFYSLEKPVYLQRELEEIEARDVRSNLIGKLVQMVVEFVTAFRCSMHGDSISCLDYRTATRGLAFSITELSSAWKCMSIVDTKGSISDHPRT
ncbi:hypothetical protein ACO22_00058 [Paracoccidioides brasiliensis]|uniref:Uncharacterized protein n=1 Tax=Paracoccidioides brasiliensis TaxID=121759 RepID=A0A1D2JQG3_PARBR|nr:hypothetical protein ACO22_00058 [Paracoccidioides brasiliensis]